MIQTERRASLIAERLSTKNKDGGPLRMVEWAALIPAIMTAISSILQCFQPDDGEQGQNYLAEQHDPGKYREKYGHYRKSVAMKATRATKFNNAAEGRRLSWPQSREIAIAVLDDARTVEDRQELSLIIQEHHQDTEFLDDPRTWTIDYDPVDDDEDTGDTE